MSYVGHTPISVSIHYLMSLQELRNDNVHSSLRVLWESVSVWSLLQGGKGKTMVRSFVPPRPRLCFLMRALGFKCVMGLGGSG